MKEPRYNIWLESDQGTRIGMLKPHRLAMVRSVESWDSIALSCSASEAALTGLTLEDFTDYRLSVYRAGTNVSSLRLENVFLIRRAAYTSKGIILDGVSGEQLLDRRIVAYAAATAQATMTDQIDDMMKEIVRDNLGADATAARQLTGLTVADNVSLGTSITKGFAWRNVLTVLDELRDISRSYGTEIFFRMVPAGTGWKFETYAGQIGGSRTDVKVGEDYGNFVLDEVAFDALEERNYIYVGGQGHESSRTITEVSDTDRIAASAYNRVEFFRSGSNQTTTAALASVGNAVLGEKQPLRIFSGDINETESFRYAVEWDFGDILTIEHNKERYSVMARKVRINMTDEGERITARVEVVNG